MMQPPFQMRAISARSMFQLYSLRAARSGACPGRRRRSSPRRARRAPPSRARSTLPFDLRGFGPRSILLGRDALVLHARQHARVDRRGDGRDRARRDRARPVAVHLPVPFCPALSSTWSTSEPPVFGSCTVSTLAVISIRNDSSGPLVPLGEHVGERVGRRARRRAQHVVRLGDELHVAVLDAVVDHLDEVAGAVGAAVGDARRRSRSWRRSPRRSA